jgi:hypothetical protein
VGPPEVCLSLRSIKKYSEVTERHRVGVWQNHCAYFPEGASSSCVPCPCTEVRGQRCEYLLMLRWLRCKTCRAPISGHPVHHLYDARVAPSQRFVRLSYCCYWLRGVNRRKMRWSLIVQYPCRITRKFIKFVTSCWNILTYIRWSSFKLAFFAQEWKLGFHYIGVASFGEADCRSSGQEIT